MIRIFVPVLLGSVLAAYSADLASGGPGPFRVSTNLVVTPVTVFDKHGAYVDGLEPSQFHLYDNNSKQKIDVDLAYQPISMVIAIQANQQLEAILPQVRKIGVMITPLVIGERGEAAVIAYDSRIRKLQEFTSNSDQITETIRTITPGGSSSRLIDAVDEGAHMLGSRPRSRRRVILLIGETRDLGSEVRAREALMRLQLSNVVLYAVDISRFIATLREPYQQPRWESRPPASFPPLPAGFARTPTTVDQAFGLEGHAAQFVPLLVELFKDARAVFNENPVELFTKGTGGREFGFYRQRGLEDAIQQIGEELHSQYLVSYSPNNTTENGFHRIIVQISGPASVGKVQTRPGYWVGPRLN